MEYLTASFHQLDIEDIAQRIPGVVVPEHGFAGVASVNGSVANGWIPTMLTSGAFADTIKQQPGGVPILWQHDTRSPIGRSTSLQETMRGLEVISPISQTLKGREAVQLMRDGVVNALSIGFDDKESRFENIEGSDMPLRIVTRAELWEISLVTFGADPEARITEVNNLDAEAREKFEAAGYQVGDLNCYSPNLHAHVSQYREFPLAPRDYTWSRHDAFNRVMDAENRQVVSGEDTDFYIYDAPRMPDSLHCLDFIDGKLCIVPGAVFAADARIESVASGLDLFLARKLIDRLYAQMREEFQDESLVPLRERDSIGGDLNYEFALHQQRMTLAGL